MQSNNSLQWKTGQLAVTLGAPEFQCYAIHDTKPSNLKPTT